MVPILTEPAPALGFLVSEGPDNHSRQQIKILAGAGAVRTLTAGMILGKRTVGTATATADSGNDGNGGMGAITVSGGAQEGRHRLVISEPGAGVGQFQVFDPDGTPGPAGTVGSAYSANGLAFTLADGANDFAAGDAFSINVLPSDSLWLQLDVAASTGEAEAAGILGYSIIAEDAVNNPNGVGIVRGPVQVNAAELVWPAGISAAAKANALLELSYLGIIAR